MEWHITDALMMCWWESAMCHYNYVGWESIGLKTQKDHSFDKWI